MPTGLTRCDYRHPDPVEPRDAPISGAAITLAYLDIRRSTVETHTRSETAQASVLA